MPPTSMSDPLRAIACLIGGLLVFSIQDVVMKQMAGNYPVHEVLAVRSLFALPAYYLIALWRGDAATLYLGGWQVLVARGFVLFLAFSCYYLAFAALPLATSISLYFTGPLFITILTVFFLHEPVRAGRWAAVVVGFAGTLVIIRPGVGVFEPAALLPVCSAFFYATSQMMARRYAGSGNALAFSFHANTAFLVGGLAAGLAFGHGAFADQTHPSMSFLMRAWVVPGARDFALMIVCGLVSLIGSMLIAEAYRSSSPPVVAPFEYTAIIWAVTNGWYFFGEIPPATTWVGVSIIIAAGLYVLSQERRR